MVGTNVAVWVSATLVALETAGPVVALPNRRWDSAAFALLGITLLTEKPSYVLSVIAGACLCFSVWITPSLAWVGLALMILMSIERRRSLVPFVLGCLLVTSICASVLQTQHALGPMLHHMLWTSRNYGPVNYMPYGSRFGGYARFRQDVSGPQLAATSLVVFGLTIPALLPPVALMSLFHWHPRWLAEPGTVRTLAVCGFCPDCRHVPENGCGPPSVRSPHILCFDRSSCRRTSPIRLVDDSRRNALFASRNAFRVVWDFPTLLASRFEHAGRNCSGAAG